MENNFNISSGHIGTFILPKELNFILMGTDYNLKPSKV